VEVNGVGKRSSLLQNSSNLLPKKVIYSKSPRSLKITCRIVFGIQILDLGVEVNGTGKRSSLLGNGNNYGRQEFYSPGVDLIKLFWHILTYSLLKAISFHNTEK
jgi:hypothetical protein